MHAFFARLDCIGVCSASRGKAEPHPRSTQDARSTCLQGFRTFGSRSIRCAFLTCLLANRNHCYSRWGEAKWGIRTPVSSNTNFLGTLPLEIRLNNPHFLPISVDNHSLPAIGRPCHVMALLSCLCVRGPLFFASCLRPSGQWPDPKHKPGPSLLCEQFRNGHPWFSLNLVQKHPPNNRNARNTRGSSKAPLF